MVRTVERRANGVAGGGGGDLQISKKEMQRSLAYKAQAA